MYIFYYLWGVKNKGHNGITPMCFHMSSILLTSSIVKFNSVQTYHLTCRRIAGRWLMMADVFLKLSDLNSDRLRIQK